MKAEIKNGIDDIVRNAGYGKDLNLYYDYKSKMVFAGDGAEEKVGIVYIGAIQTPITAAQIQELVNAVLSAVYIGTSLVVPEDTAKYTGAVIYNLFDEMGGEIQNYDGFLMSCYLWKVYTSRHSEKSDGEEATLYIASDGDSFVRDNTERKEIWYENYEVFPQGVYLAVNLPEKFAAESIYTIAAAVLLYVRTYKKALECQRKYLARKETINDEA